MTSDEYQQAFDDITGQGYRLTWVNGYDVAGQERFAAIWQADGGPAIWARHNMTSDEYQQAFNDITGQGYRLTCVSGYTVGEQERFAAIWQDNRG
jgi:triacylglycerol esterase/lipase EstA (alpha/beta hydrolase family)